MYLSVKHCKRTPYKLELIFFILVYPVSGLRTIQEYFNHYELSISGIKKGVLLERHELKLHVDYIKSGSMGLYYIGVLT